jgi:hypothetical protein
MQQGDNKDFDRLADMYKRVFISPAGQDVLDDLEATYDGNLAVTGDTHRTYYNLGQRDVVRYIKALIAREQAND